MQFTAKFTTLACAVVAAMLSQVTAKPAPVDTIHTNITHVGNPIDSAAPPPAGLHHFQCSTNRLEGNICSVALGDVIDVIVAAKNTCTPIVVPAGKTVQCTRLQPPTEVVDDNIKICKSADCKSDCYSLDSASPLKADFYSTEGAISILYETST